MLRAAGVFKTPKLTMRAPRIPATHQECKAVKISGVAMALWFLLVLFATESNLSLIHI